MKPLFRFCLGVAVILNAVATLYLGTALQVHIAAGACR